MSEAGAQVRWQGAFSAARTSAGSSRQRHPLGSRPNADMAMIACQLVTSR